MDRGDDYIARPRERRRDKKTRAQLAAERGLRGSRPRLQKLILRGLNGDGSGGTIAAAIAEEVRTADADAVSAGRQLLVRFATMHPGLADASVLRALFRLSAFKAQWTGRLEDWTPPTSRRHGERAWSLALHLLARYPVPEWLRAAWDSDDALSAPARLWFAHIGSGRNFRDAPDLPYPLTKLMAHWAVAAPAGLWPGQALRYGQLRGAGVQDGLARAIATGTRLGWVQRDEGFWLHFAPWVARNPGFGNYPLASMTNYIHAARFGDFGEPEQPDFTFTNLNVQTLAYYAQLWEQRREKMQQGRNTRWRSCGINGLDGPKAPDSRHLQYRIVELLSAGQLQAEGDAMDHCVAQYWEDACTGHSAIYSLRRLQRGKLVPSTTIELLPESRRVVQARTRGNQMPPEEDLQVIAEWAALRRLICAYDD